MKSLKIGLVALFATSSLNAAKEINIGSGGKNGNYFTVA
jgi:hypothetical protein